MGASRRRFVYLRFPHGSTKYITWKDPTHKRAVFLATFEYAWLPSPASWLDTIELADSYD